MQDYCEAIGLGKPSMSRTVRKASERVIVRSLLCLSGT